MEVDIFVQRALQLCSTSGSFFWGGPYLEGQGFQRDVIIALGVIFGILRENTPEMNICIWCNFFFICAILNITSCPLKNDKVKLKF